MNQPSVPEISSNVTSGIHGFLALCRTVENNCRRPGKVIDANQRTPCKRQPPRLQGGPHLGGSGTPPASACPVPPGTRGGDPGPERPPLASPRTSCASTTTPPCAGTSTAVRSS